MKTTTIDQVLSHRSILITCGTGGVGKTTLSAAMAIRSALQGRNTLVVTIDPAKRLAQSLGLENLGSEPTDLTPLLTHELGKKPPGALAALVPETSKTFESLLEDLAPGPVLAESMRRNPIFQIFTQEFSGANEYMALQCLLTLARSKQFDQIILDTPPSRNTMAFLNAPHLLSQLFEERLLRWLVLPANRLLAAGMKKSLSLLEKLTGQGFMTHLVEFAAALLEVQTQFTQSLGEITHLLESKQVGFLMVGAPHPEKVEEVHHFVRQLQERQFHFEGLILNRTFGHLDLGSIAETSAEAYGVLKAVQQREAKALELLDRPSLFTCAKLPELTRDVHSLKDLLYVATSLFDSEHRRSQPDSPSHTAHEHGTHNRK